MSRRGCRREIGWEGGLGGHGGRGVIVKEICPDGAEAFGGECGGVFECIFIWILANIHIKFATIIGWAVEG